MTRFLLLVAVCLLPIVVANAFSSGNPFLLKGSVYCDTCRVGFETPASRKLPGAAVQLVCRHRDNPDIITYKRDCVTNSKGEFNLLVSRDAGDDICDMVLVKSPDPECATPDEGRSSARVCLTRNNGMVSDTRFANNMGFLQNVPLAHCPQILQQYADTEASN